MNTALENLGGIASNALKMRYAESVEKWNREQQRQRQEAIDRNAIYEQMMLQDALGHVLVGVTVSDLLVALRDKRELIPHGYSFDGEKVTYTYSWMKTGNRKTPDVVLSSVSQKIDALIQMEQHRILTDYWYSDPFHQQYLLEYYPAFFWGFALYGCRDNGMDILLDLVWA